MERKHELATLLTNASGWKSLLVFVVLCLAWVVGFSSRLFAVIRFESIIHEFDPWFNYRSTHYMVENGFYNFLNWFDSRAWYPLGRIVGGTVYPGLMITSGTIHYILHILNIPVHIRDVCVFLAPIFSGLTAIATYFLTKELWSTGAGLLAACFIAIVPGYISRSVAGSYDNEGIAIFALQITYYFWLKSVNTGSIMYSVLTALSYFYMVSAWGGYVYIINLIPIHVFVLLIMGRYSHRLMVSYTTFYTVGTLCSMQVPFVGMQPLRTSEHMAALGVFALLFAYALIDYVRSKLTRAAFKSMFILAVGVAAGTVLLGVILLTSLGYVAPWSGRFYSLWDTGYAKVHIPIIASVSEHQPTTWTSFFFDLHVLICTFPAGLWIVVRNINDVRVFVVLYALTAVYFAGVMVRLMLTLTPVVCILAAIAFSSTLEYYLKDDRNPQIEDEDLNDEESDGDKKGSKKLYDKAGKTRRSYESPTNEEAGESVGMNVRTCVILIIGLLLLYFCMHCTWVTANAYSSPSIVLSARASGGRSVIDDFREAYYWLRKNTAEDATVMSWWDYGYQIAGMGNRTTLVDNNTWNNSHIALVGKAMSSNETAAYEIMKTLGVNYVLVIFGGVIGYSGDDINKFLWMVRIGEGEHPNDIREGDYFTEQGEFRVDAGGSQTLLNCLMYKLSYHEFGKLQMSPREPPGFDRTRYAEIGNKHFQLTYLEEAYTTEHWLVRIYKVKDVTNREKLTKFLIKSKSKKSRFITKKTRSKRKGTIKNRPVVVRGKRNKKRT